MKHWKNWLIHILTAAVLAGSVLFSCLPVEARAVRTAGEPAAAEASLDTEEAAKSALPGEAAGGDDASSEEDPDRDGAFSSKDPDRAGASSEERPGNDDASAEKSPDRESTTAEKSAGTAGDSAEAGTDSDGAPAKEGAKSDDASAETGTDGGGASLREAADGTSPAGEAGEASQGGTTEPPSGGEAPGSLLPGEADGSLLMEEAGGSSPLEVADGSSSLEEAGSSSPLEEADDGSPLEEADAVEEYVPAQDGFAADDVGSAFAAYVSRELDLSGSLSAETGDLQVSTPRLRKNYASNSLTGANRLLYGMLLEEIRKVAAGERTETIFFISLEDLGLEPLSWTPEDLGVDSFLQVDAEGKKSLTQEASSIISGKIRDAYGISFRPLVKTLLADCPYDLYWYEKTQSSTYSPGLSYYTSGSRVFFKGPLRFSLPVSQAYADPAYSSGGKYYGVSTQSGTLVRTARENARAIVEKYSGGTDYEKLAGYKNEILDLASYDRAAASSRTTPYGDPWQLLYVFDGDPATNVVCEGYSKSFQYLCDLSTFHDIFRECISVTGTMTGGTGAGSGHMWNLVLLQDGRTYLADLTNCDNGTVGSADGRSVLFLAGLRGAEDADTRLAEGSFSAGYTFHPTPGSSIGYVYDADTLSDFTQDDLTLAEGRVSAGTTAEGTQGPTHTHIFLFDPMLEPTCTETGLTAGSHCAICGETGVAQTVLPMTPHTPDEGAWTQTQAPTYAREGVEATTCTACGTVLTRAVAKLEKRDQSLLMSVPDLSTEMFRAASIQVKGAEGALSFALAEASGERILSLDRKTGQVTPLQPGTAKVVVTAAETESCLAARKEITVSVLPCDLSRAPASVTLDPKAASMVYNGKAKTPAVLKVTDGLGHTLAKGTDYAVSYSGNVNASSASSVPRVLITGKGRYRGSISRTFAIRKAAQPITIRAAASTVAAGKTTKVSVSSDATVGRKGTKTWTSSNTAIAAVGRTTGTVTAKKPGTVTITMTSAAPSSGNYLLTKKSVTIRVVPAATAKLTAANQAAGIRITWAKVSGASGYHIYRNGGKVPYKTIAGGGTVAFTDAKASSNGTKYTYRVVARAASGTSTLSRSVTIRRLSRPEVRTLKNCSGRKLQLAWTKNAKATGYQIQYSSRSDFGTTKTLPASGAGTVSRTLTGFTKGKTYYVRVRAVFKSGAASWYSAWSPVKSVKIRK